MKTLFKAILAALIFAVIVIVLFLKFGDPEQLNRFWQVTITSFFTACFLFLYDGITSEKMHNGLKQSIHPAWMLVVAWLSAVVVQVIITLAY